MSGNITPTKNNVLDAITVISEKSKDSELSEKIWTKLSSQLELVCMYLKVTQVQAFLVSNIFALNYTRGGVDIDDICTHFGCNPLTILKYKTDFETLNERKILLKSRKEHGPPIAFGEFDFIVSRDVGDAILNNQPIQEKKLKKKDSVFDLLFKVKELIHNRRDSDLSSKLLFNDVEDLILSYKHLLLVKQIVRLSLNIEEVTLLFYLFSFAINGESEVNIETITADLYNDVEQRFRVKRRIYNRNLRLFTLNLVKLSKNMFVSGLEISLTDKALNELFGKEANLLTEQMDVQNFKNVTFNEKIERKSLYFNHEDARSLEFLERTIRKRNFANIQKRLKAKHLPIGMNVMFYGAPGTGKTESALQMARKSGRHIMKVEISESKSMWYGESEKKIKEIFDQYRKFSRLCKTTPILLFNEADALFGKRVNNLTSSTDNTENAMQNILLEEMEKMKGIMIATTNLHGNMDKAFERRFLHKVLFHVPDMPTKTKIWRTKLPGLSKENYNQLSRQFNFSGGQIENVVRKAITYEILNHNKPDFRSLVKYCEEEGFEKEGKTAVGFK